MCCINKINILFCFRLILMIFFLFASFVIYYYYMIISLIQLFYLLAINQYWLI